MLKGGGGNTAVFVQANGVTVVDTKNPGWGQPILDKIKELTQQAGHDDHQHPHARRSRQRQRRVPGDRRHRGAREHGRNMKKMAPSSSAAGSDARRPRHLHSSNSGRGLPKRTFKDKMTLGSGADQIDLYYFGRGHTNGDAWVVFPALRVMHAGDIFSGKNLPLLDANNGGSGVEIGDTLAKAAQRAQERRQRSSPATARG